MPNENKDNANAPEYSVVLPAFNEEKNIAPIYNELKTVLVKLSPKFEIIFIDDGSSDGTYREIAALHEKDSRVKAVKFKRNFGQTAALEVGFRHAKGKIVISMDCDLQDDPKEIPSMIAKMSEGYDVVCAWRAKRSDKISKRIMSLLAYTVRKIVVHDGVHDSGCQFRVYTHEAVSDIELYGDLHRFIPALLRLKGYKVTEKVVNHRPRIHGQTKYKFSRVFKGLADIITLQFWNKYGTRPTHFFGAVGAILLAIGCAAVAYLGWTRLFLGQAIGNRPLLIISTLFIIVGVQLFLMGFLADILMRTYYRSSDVRPYTIEKVLE